MPNKKHLLLIIPVCAILFSSLFFISCTKPFIDLSQLVKDTVLTLPPITTTGAGTFGCKVNGKVWLPKSSWPSTSPSKSVSLFKNRLSVSGYNSDTKENVSFFVGEISDTIRLDFPSQSLTTSICLHSTIIDNKSVQFESDPIMKGQINILRFDPTNGIFSGTFEFDVYDIYSQSKGDTIHITEGRFDLYK